MGSCLSSEGQQKGDAEEIEQDEKTREVNTPNANGIVLGGTFDLEFLRKGGVIGEDDLLQIGTRMFLSGHGRFASLYTRQGTRVVNQDAMLVWENFCSIEDTIFCGVFDGHGPFGHMVSKKVRDSLPLKLSCLWEASDGDLNGLYAKAMSSEEMKSSSLDNEWSESLDTYETKNLPDKHLKLKHSLLKAFKLMDEDLKLHPKIDSFNSGTTAVTLIKQGQDLVIGNVGDSRAILGTRDEDNKLIAIQLTVDLKPDLPREAARIKRHRGRVLASWDEGGLARVYSPNDDSIGLAMTRAFGDFYLKEYGLISVPEISFRRLTERDEFIILATDGVWDVLSNEEAVDIVASTPHRAGAAKALVDRAGKAWKTKFSPSVCDDCAAVCLFLGPSTTTETETTNG
ncbi:hypothetical protein AAC387_Pa09g1157 [Persea americana]